LLQTLHSQEEGSKNLKMESHETDPFEVDLLWSVSMEFGVLNCEERMNLD